MDHKQLKYNDERVEDDRKSNKRMSELKHQKSM